MDVLSYKSIISNDKPDWLLRLQMEISQSYALRGMEDTPEEWQELKGFIDDFIDKLYVRKDVRIRSEITSYLMKEDGQTQLLIKRNGKLLQSYYIKKQKI